METTIEQLENGTAKDQVIEIKAIYKTAGKHTLQPAFNSQTGWWAGVERLSDDDLRKRDYYVTVGKTGSESNLNTKIALKDGHIMDLSNKVDRINWEWLKHCPEIAMSFAEAQSSKALFYVHIEGREAELTNSKTEEMFEAMRLVMEDPTTNYENRALLLNMDMEGERPAVIKEFLLEKAKKDPKAILRIYRNKYMKINLLYLKAKKSNKIIVNPNDNVIRYGHTILGVSDDSAIAYLQANEDILELLEREVNPEYFVTQTTKQDSKMTPIQLAQAARAAKLGDKFEEE
jgi:hypothetical protein